MARFLVLLGEESDASTLDERFGDGLAVAEELSTRPAARPHSRVARDSIRAAAFARDNGTGAPIVEDLLTGSWLLAAGTWFHRDGFASGEEGRLLERYRHAGVDALARELEGFYVVIVHDTLTRETHVITDPTGSFHAFERDDRGAIALSGSSLLLAALGPGAIDPVGAQEFLYTGIVYEGRTVHAGVRKLPAGSIVTYKGDRKIATRRWWSIADVDPEALDGDRAVDAVSDVLLGAASRIGRLHPDFVSDLTGGRDSRTVAAAFFRAGVPLRTVVCGDASDRDVVVAREVARVGAFPHLHLRADDPVTPADLDSAITLTDGEYDLVEYARIERIHRTLSTRFGATLNGTYGEVARGHWWGKLLHRAGRREPLDVRNIARMRFITQPFDSRVAPPELRLDLNKHFEGAVERTNAGLGGIPNTAQMHNLYLMLRLQHWHGRIASATDRIWPCLSPFALRSVIETVSSVAPRARRNNVLVARILEKIAPSLARVPLVDGASALPLTFANLPWFASAPVHAVRRALRRLRPPHGRSVSPRAALQGDPAIRDLMDPDAMRVGTLLDRGALRAFLSASRGNEFAMGGQWNRTLSLEMTLRRVEAIRRRTRVAGDASAILSP